MTESPRGYGRVRVRARESGFARNVIQPLYRYVRIEETAGWPLIIFAVLALVWANSPWSASYEALWSAELGLDLGFTEIRESLRHWIDLALLPFFFFVIGMEMRREFALGTLSDWKTGAAPIVTGAGGMLVPAAIFLALTWGTDAQGGFGVPVATDIAFALAIVAVLRDRIPSGLRVLILAFAMVDDIGGVLIIAVFYSHGFSPGWLAAAALVLAAVVTLIRMGMRLDFPYALLAVVFWFTVHQAGIHATIAGVILGLVTPPRPLFDPDEVTEQGPDLLDRFERARRGPRRDEDERGAEGGDEEELEDADAYLGQLEELVVRTESPSIRLMRWVNPWVSYFVLPLFALSAAGVPLGTDALGEAVTSRAAQAVFAGLVVGKPLGILLFGWLGVKLGLMRLPEELGWGHLAAMGLLASIGFTISLFIAGVAFQGDDLTAVKTGVLAASVVGSALGVGALAWATGRSRR